MIPHHFLMIPVIKKFLINEKYNAYLRKITVQLESGGG